MASPGVAQLEFLNGLFAELLLELQPRSLAVLGCTTGNGFEHINPEVTCRIVGVDINPRYLRVASERFARCLPYLGLITADITALPLRSSTFDLIHCALVLEYVDSARVLPSVAAGLRKGGTLAVVLQLPSHTEDTVSPSPLASLRRLAPVMRLVDPNHLAALAFASGLHLARADTWTLPAGKSFWLARFSRP